MTLSRARVRFFLPPGSSGRRRRIALLGAVGSAGGGAAIALVAVNLAAALLPVALAAVSGVVVERLGQAARLSELSWPLTALFAVLTANQATVLLSQPLGFLIERRVNTATRRLAEDAAAADPGIALLEDSAFQDRVHRATQEVFGTTAGAAAAALVELPCRYVGAVSAGVLYILGVGPWGVLVVAGVVGTRVYAASRALSNRRVVASHSGNWRKGDYWASLATTANSAREVRIFGIGGWLTDRFRRSREETLRPLWAARESLIRSLVQVYVLHVLLVGGALALLILAVSGGRISAGWLTASMGALWPMFALCRVGPEILQIEAGAAGLEAARDLGRRATAEPDGPAPAVPAGITAVPRRSRTARVKGRGSPPEVRFEEVSFTYPGSSRPVLDRCSLVLRPGEALAVVGLNGAGKSTLAKLLTALHQPTSGRVLADGVDIRTLDPDEWRSRLAVLFQDFVHYELPFRDNVVLGAGKEEGDDLILQAAMADAAAGSLLDSLPQGWRTPLSTSRSGGTNLSGGQWQRVALARTFYAARSGSQIMVLDEPTAHLDVRTEKDVFDRIIDRGSGLSLVLVSHRLATVRRADRIVLLEGGRVAEEGSHDELLAAKGQYAQMFTLQAQRLTRTSTEESEA